MSNQQLQTTTNQEAKNIDIAVFELINTSKSLGPFERALKKAEIIAMISTALDNSGQMKSVMAMQGKQYGFRTDSKTPEGYKEEIVKACLIEATLRGVEPTGNMFNILGGNCYITKEGCKHILQRMNVPYRVECGLRKKLPNLTWVVPCNITWGEGNSKYLEVVVTVFDSTKEETSKGAAQRDAMAWLIEELTALPMVVGNVEKDDVTITEHEVITEETVGKVQSKANESEQIKFDKYISRSTSLEDLEKRVSISVSTGGFENKEYFDLTLYNKLKNETLKL